MIVDYKDIQGWFDNEKLYQIALDSISESGHFVEVGAWKGKSAFYMMELIDRSNKDIKFDVVDMWVGTEETDNAGYAKDRDTLYQQFINNMMKWNNKYTPLKMSSVEASKQYEDNSLDFVYIDANHSYESVLEDIISWYPKVKKGGILAGDDYNEGWPGVMRAVNEQFPKSVFVPNNGWMVKK